MGTETPANSPFCSARPVAGTKLPSSMPAAMARRIHAARKRSSQPRDWKADAFCVLVFAGLGSCFSGSEKHTVGSVVSWAFL